MSTEPLSPPDLFSIFGREKVFLPVIHPVRTALALASIQVAWDSGADGIFLINQGMDEEGVLRLARSVQRQYPDWWIGVNILGATANKLSFLTQPGDLRIDGFWADDDEVFRTFRPHAAWRGLTFGGVAFKYQKHVPDDKLAQVAKRAASLVPTTSGTGTGRAPRPEKLAEMKRGLGSRPLAVASGIDCNNITELRGYAQAFLVATGIEKQFGVLDPEATRLLSALIHTPPEGA